jgi:hypothetical protein
MTKLVAGTPEAVQEFWAACDFLFVHSAWNTTRKNEVIANNRYNAALTGLNNAGYIPSDADKYLA